MPGSSFQSPLLAAAARKGLLRLGGYVVKAFVHTDWLTGSRVRIHEPARSRKVEPTALTRPE